MPGVPTEPRLAFLGHSTVLVEFEGVRVLTDPVVRDRVTVLDRVSAPPSPRLYAGVDVAVISHLHLDHLDLPSLRLLSAGVRLVAPRGAGELLRRAGFEDVTELAVGRSLRVGDLVITATPALHSGYRPPLGPRGEAIGYLIEGRERRVYFAGDTDLFPGMGSFGPEIDVALLPVWGWGPTLGPGHLDPARAAAAMSLLRPRFAVPIHWGSLWPRGLRRLHRGRLSEPPREFAARAAVTHPDGRVLLTAPGQEVALPN